MNTRISLTGPEFTAIANKSNHNLLTTAFQNVTWKRMTLNDGRYFYTPGDAFKGQEITVGEGTCRVKDVTPIANLALSSYGTLLEKWTIDEATNEAVEPRVERILCPALPDFTKVIG